MKNKLFFGIGIATLVLMSSVLALNDTKVNILPDSNWYSLEKLGEGVHEFILFNPEDKANYLVVLSERRVEESELMQAKADSLNCDFTDVSCNKIKVRYSGLAEKSNNESLDTLVRADSFGKKISNAAKRKSWQEKKQLQLNKQILHFQSVQQKTGKDTSIIISKLQERKMEISKDKIGVLK